MTLTNRVSGALRRGGSAWAQCIVGRVLASASSGRGRFAPAARGDGRPCGGLAFDGAGFRAARACGARGATVIPHAYRPKRRSSDLPPQRGQSHQAPLPADPDRRISPPAPEHPADGPPGRQVCGLFQRPRPAPNPARRPPSQTNGRPAPEAPIKTPKASQAAGDPTCHPTARTRLARETSRADVHAGLGPHGARPAGPTRAHIADACRRRR
jgi:hypothetical protein